MWAVQSSMVTLTLLTFLLGLRSKKMSKLAEWSGTKKSVFNSTTTLQIKSTPAFQGLWKRPVTVHVAWEN